MSFPFGPAPTLGEVIARAEAFGAEVRHSPVIATGPNGPIRFSYLWIDRDHFVPLPDLSYSEPLAPDMVSHFARRLGIATEEFWPGFRGFDADDESEDNSRDE